MTASSIHALASAARDVMQAAAFRLLLSERRKEAIMAKDHGNSVKDDKKYEALKDKGMSKERAAKIANSGKEGSKKGGKNSN